MEKLILLLLICIGIYSLFLLIRISYLKWKYSKEKVEGENFSSFIRRDECLREMIWVLPIGLLALFIHYYLEHNSVYKIIMSLMLLALGIYFINSAFKKVRSDEIGDEKIEKKKVVLPLFLFMLASVFVAKSFQVIAAPYFLYVMLLLSVIFIIGEFNRKEKVDGKKKFNLAAIKKEIKGDPPKPTFHPYAMYSLYPLNNLFAASEPANSVVPAAFSQPMFQAGRNTWVPSYNPINWPPHLIQTIPRGP